MNQLYLTYLKPSYSDIVSTRKHKKVQMTNDLNINSARYEAWQPKFDHIDLHGRRELTLAICSLLSTLYCDSGVHLYMYSR